MADNLLIIYVDTVSRQKSYLKLPQTMKFFKETESIEMFRLHSFVGNTYENAIAFLYGLHLDNISSQAHPKEFQRAFEPKLPSIFQHFQEQGFITGYTSDVCEAGIFGQKADIGRYVQNKGPDYEGNGVACDPHYYDYMEGVGPW